MKKNTILKEVPVSINGSSSKEISRKERWLIMKKTLIGLFLVLGAASFADAGKIEARGGIDLGGQYHYGKDWKNQKTKNSSG